jgi:putative two-component system protein, hydrogenase maturation factor HypX/HoxX
MPNLRAGDSSPGVADIIDGDRFHLYGAHEDDYLHGPPGTILGQRHGAICRATGDGDDWIERIKSAEPATLKLPAARRSRPPSARALLRASTTFGRVPTASCYHPW